MINPVLRREAKTTLRNWKIFYAVAGYVLIVTIVAAIAIWQLMYNSYNASFDPASMINVYIGLTVLQLVLVLLMTPAFTAGSISGERERQTLDLLLVSAYYNFNNAYICINNVFRRNKYIIYICRNGIYAFNMRSIWSNIDIFFNGF